MVDEKVTLDDIFRVLVEIRELLKPSDSISKPAINIPVIDDIKVPQRLPHISTISQVIATLEHKSMHDEKLTANEVRAYVKK